MFLSLGEIMLRFCSGELPLRAAKTFHFSEGGGEYNIARSLSRSFGESTGIATAMVDNEIGHLVHHLILSSGVDTSNIIWRKFDGVGRECRNPLYFAERGFGYRSPKATMDRGHSAPAQLAPGDFDWDTLFSSGDITWFHTGGIFAGLSESTSELALEAIQCARKHGITTSYDPNYRESLWMSRGGPKAAAEVNRAMAQHTDVLLGVSPIFHEAHPPLECRELISLMEDTAAQLPSVKTIAASSRVIHSASMHDYCAKVWHNGEIYHSDQYKNAQVLDRIGSGDAFGAGMIYGLMHGKAPDEAANIGCANAVLTMSTPCDSTLCSKKEILSLAATSTSHELR
ncbi:2-dehydro-3-deoxygluconokinase [Rubritalea squalenifaciens DSM 18772]|uniref:2-dehydro-3-deoxygluconokinase n=2 Tax=Rubritalea squalenifaciens TaxID=407226 RepID=A0A1M6E516_9BACT|nr:2-dehydro-3-deoxygluconokinase [Rubritalea squalenifaciens DSM 18772]